MDSGSNSSSATPSNYDVFLSFHGADTRRQFVDHLYDALSRNGIHTFRDDEELPRGNTIRPELINAIRQSAISVAIFSEKYATSEWLLDELSAIMGSRKSAGMTVIPVFYGVDPNVVREQTGSFAEAFRIHEEAYGANNSKIVKWRDALREAASLDGFEFDNRHGSETRLLSMIVHEVKKYLSPDILDVAKYPAGLESPKSPFTSRTRVDFGESSMDSASTSSSATPRWNYDVFLSFRGADVRYTIVDHLYNALTRNGIYTFRDDEELPRGNTIRLELINAIRESRISIVVFSPHYATSRWCLEELVQIMECRKSVGPLVLPVFYHVDPSDVRKQRGSFSEAFACHEAKYGANNPKVENWRDALREAANLVGFAAQGHEGRLLSKIVDEVDRYLSPDIFDVAKYPVGLKSPDSHVESVQKILMTNQNDVQMVGLYGMGGIGKTTISKALYNAMYRRFEGCCFLANVRAESQRTNGLVLLQKTLLCKTLKRETFDVGNVYEGICLIKRRLCHKKVLIVLDDVDNLQQFNSLAGDRGWFGPGSKIILTTRNKHLLNQAQVNLQHEVTELVTSDSLSLFSFHAFQRSEPSEGFMEISNKIVRYTRGLPLALEVIGASLFGKDDMNYWESTLEKLQKVPHCDIHKILMISFDALDDHMQKSIFLDISCFFIGMDREQAIDVFDGCGLFGEIGVTALTDRCLLTISKTNKLQMHDLIRDMGREIVCAESHDNPGKRSRLWDHEDMLHVLKKHKGSEEIRGLVLDPSTVMHLTTDAFSGMKNLALLQINNVKLNGSFDGLFDELRWLRWHHFPSRCLPPKFSPEKLAYLDLQHSSVTILWQGTKRFDKLRILDLSNSKFETTPNFTQLPGVEKLSLRFCSNLLKVHPSIGLLDKLIRLDLGSCNKLKSLPSSICNLTNLEHLDLDFCSSFDSLPERLGDMEGLKKLFARGTAIKQLPDSIGKLKQLTWLTLEKCNKNIEARPWFPFSLLEKAVKRSVATRLLPPSISSLCLLINLDLSECNLIESDMPDDLAGLTQLRTLHLERNKFCVLPRSLAQLSNLESLWLDGCKNLHSILGCPPKLKGLHASNCTSLKNIHYLSNLTFLETLDFTNCSSLVEMHGLENLDSVLLINLEGCCNLTTTFENTVFEGYTHRKKDCAIYFPRRKLPHWFEYKGPSISFEVPLNVEPNSLQLTLWVNYVSDEEEHNATLRANVYNMKTGIKWTYHGRSSKTTEAKTWVIQGPQPHPIKNGDRIEVSIAGAEGLIVEECGVHLAYRTEG